MAALERSSDDNVFVQDFLGEQHFMVLAVTLDDGTPWAVPVRISRWQGREFEWDSKTDTLHSQARARRAAMAGRMCNPTQQVGVYMSGHGELVSESGSGFGHYRFTAERAWLNDETFVKREVSL